MKHVLIAFCLIYLLSSCHKGCHCNTDQVCLDNTCVCGEFTEGDSCMPMRNKFIGTFIGTLSMNGGVAMPDTIEFYGGGDQINYVYSPTPQ
jgi:hypothetical protein